MALLLSIIGRCTLGKPFLHLLFIHGLDLIQLLPRSFVRYGSSIAPVVVVVMMMMVLTVMMNSGRCW